MKDMKCSLQIKKLKKKKQKKKKRLTCNKSREEKVDPCKGKSLEAEKITNQYAKLSCLKRHIREGQKALELLIPGV